MPESFNAVDAEESQREREEVTVESRRAESAPPGELRVAPSPPPDSRSERSGELSGKLTASGKGTASCA